MADALCVAPRSNLFFRLSEKISTQKKVRKKKRKCRKTWKVMLLAAEVCAVASHLH